MCSRRFMGVIASRFSSETERGSRQAGKQGSGNGTSQSLSPMADILQRLGRVQVGSHRVVSCYLKLEPRDRIRGKYQIKLKNRIKVATQGLPRLGLSRPESEAVFLGLGGVPQVFQAEGKLPANPRGWAFAL